MRSLTRRSRSSVSRPASSRSSRGRPKKRQDLWRRHGVAPRGIDREVVQALHQTAPANDQNVENLLDAAIRSSLGSGWGGSMLATDLQDCIFGTPVPVRSSANLGVLKADEVNILIHGHEPLLSSLIVEAAHSPEMQALAEKVGAKGVNLAGICCTANETLMRQGVPPAGNMLHQELAILTGAVEAMVVDIQCIFQGLSEAASHFHTLLFSTSPKAKIGEGGEHIDVDEHNPMETATDIVRRAIENFPNRKEIHIPTEQTPLVAGFSHEYIRYMLGGKMRASFRPLNDNIINGRIRGLAAVVGCSNARVVQDHGVVNVVRELIANNVLVVVTGCSAITSGKHGLLAPETMEFAGPGLKEICDAIGIPPVLHIGSCVDNSRILTILSEVVSEGGLGEDISDLPAVAISPEWFSEKALEIGTYAIGSGASVIFGGVGSPVSASQYVVDYMENGWMERFGAGFFFIEEPQGHRDQGARHHRRQANRAQDRRAPRARPLRHGHEEGAQCLRSSQALPSAARTTGSSRLRRASLRSRRAVGAEHAVEFPNTAYYLPVIYGLTGEKVEKLSDMDRVLGYARDLLPEVPTEKLWLPYLGTTLDAGIASLLAEECIEAMKYVDGSASGQRHLARRSRRRDHARPRRGVRGRLGTGLRGRCRRRSGQRDRRAPGPRDAGEDALRLHGRSRQRQSLRRAARSRGRAAGLGHATRAVRP